MCELLLLGWFVKVGKSFISKYLKWCFFLPLISWILNIYDRINNGLCEKCCWFVDLWNLGKICDLQKFEMVFFLPLICWIVNICDRINNGLCAKSCWFVDLRNLWNMWTQKIWNGVFSAVDLLKCEHLWSYR